MSSSFSLRAVLGAAPLFLALPTAVLAQGNGGASFQTFLPEFRDVLGAAPKITKLYEANRPLFHEAAIYYAPTRSLFVSSNQIDQPNPATNDKAIFITRVSGLDAPASVRLERIPAPRIPLPNGGVRWLPSPDGVGDDQLVWCAQGNLRNDPPGGLVAMKATPPYAQRNILPGYYGTPFNSPNDVVVSAKDGALYFTDPPYGFVQGVRPAPKLRAQVYRFDPATNSTRVVADGFSRPNGIAFGVGESVLYVSDTGLGVGDGTEDPARPATIYAYDVQDPPGGDGPFLGNRRVFAYATNGIPDGVKVDSRGRVYTGEGDGVAVYSADADLIGKIRVDGGVANFNFGEPGELFLLNEERLFRVDVSKTVKGASAPRQ